MSSESDPATKKALKGPIYWYSPKLVTLVIVVGILAGIGSILFYILLEFFNEFFSTLLGIDIGKPAGEPELFNFKEFLSFVPYPINLLLVLLAPAFGGFISGILTYFLAPEAKGEGVDAVIKAFHRKFGVISGRVPIIKSVSSAIFIGSGGSVGREGPIAQIAAGVASLLADKTRISPRERELLVVVGMSAGIGGLFRAPAGGALFGIEVLYKRDYESDALPYAIIASFLAFSIFCVFAGWRPMFAAPQYTISFREIPFYVILGIVCGLFARLYIVIYEHCEKFFSKLNMKDYIKPVIGGLIVGVLAILTSILVGEPYIFGSGYGPLQLILNKELFLKTSIAIILLIAILKMVATSVSIGSGGSGGAFAPSVTIGGFIGGVVGAILKTFFPQYIVNDIGIFAIVGMASFFAAAANVPLTAIIMTAEITWDFSILAPAIIAVGISYLIAFEPSIYREQVPDRPSSPVHMADHLFLVFRNLRVKDILSPDTMVVIKADTPAEEAMNIMIRNQRMYLPVVDENGKCIGIVDIFDLTSLMARNKRKLVKEVVRKAAICVYPDEPLLLALAKAKKANINVLPVIDPKTKKTIGEVSYHDMIKAFYAKLGELGLLK